jgi:hypothetical protein
MSEPIPRLLTVFDVAELLHMPPARVSRLARAGAIPHIELPDKEFVFSESDLAEWLVSRKRQEIEHGK